MSGARGRTSSAARRPANGRAAGRYERMPRRLLQLFAGLVLYGLGIALLLRSDLGTASWDVLSTGIIRHFPISFGLVTVIVSAAVLLCWIPLREKPGLGTVLNALLVGPFADLGLLLIPQTDTLWLRALYLLGGIAIVGLATGVYIGSRLGPGPRDGLMTGLHRVTRLPIWVVRTGLEVVVVAIGWLLGGAVGVGTVLFAVLIGPLCQLFLPIFTIPLARDATEETDGAASD